MKRIETYIGQQVMEWCFSAQAQNDMVGLSKLSAAVLGTGVLANGLACAPTSPATMTVQIGPGELYSMQALEATACGTLPANTANTILKQGIQLGTYTSAALAAPLTTGQSINYLIEAQYQDSDISIDPTTGTSPVVLQFFNSANPAVPWSGPNNSGSTSNTFRDGIIAYQIKAGTAAATGSQVTPTPDAGWTGLWVVSVPFAATTLTAGNISSYSAAPILPSGLLQSLISGNLTYGIDAGTANVIQATYPVPITSLVDNMELWVKVKNANTGATTFTPNPGVISPSPVVGAAHAALQGGEYVANGRALHVWRADISSWVLVECTGAAIQVAPATASQHAVQFGQVSGVVGQVRNLAANLATAGASVTFTADEIIVESALGGLRYCLSSFSKTLNVGAVGVNGMDTGTAPANGTIAIYAIYNPTTQTAGLLAQSVGTTVAPSVYGGASMPSGYTASALISAVPVSSTAGQLLPFYQQDRKIGTSPITALTTSTTVTATPLVVSVPANAKRLKGFISMGSTVTSVTTVSLYDNSASIGPIQVGFTSFNASGGGQSLPFYNLELSVVRTIYYSFSTTGAAGTANIVVLISGYEI